MRQRNTVGRRTSLPGCRSPSALSSLYLSLFSSVHEKNNLDITLNYSIANFVTSFQIPDRSPIITSHIVMWSEQVKASLNKARKQTWRHLLNKVKPGHLEDLVILKKILRQERERNGIINWTKRSGSIQEYSSWPVETRQTFKDEFHVYCRVVGLLYSEYHVLRDLQTF